jgi:hypothetical protein
VENGLNIAILVGNMPRIGSGTKIKKGKISDFL